MRRHTDHLGATRRTALGTDARQPGTRSCCPASSNSTRRWRSTRPPSWWTRQYGFSAAAGTQRWRSTTGGSAARPACPACTRRARKRLDHRIDRGALKDSVTDWSNVVRAASLRSSRRSEKDVSQRADRPRQGQSPAPAIRARYRKAVVQILLFCVKRALALSRQLRRG